ncbi:MAG: Flagellar hook protein FlgE [Rhodospirillaceae bacterium]|nr:MAG: Flagellar hook protein FlgE [Rhodospirillaceae bacterium]
MRPLNLYEMGGTATPTHNIRLGANLPSEDEIGKSHKTNVLIYDSLGNDHSLQYTWTKIATNKWDLEVAPPPRAETLNLKNVDGNIYAAMGRLDFRPDAVPTVGSSVTINGDTYDFVSGTSSNIATRQIAVGSGDLGTIATDLANSMNLTKGTAQTDTITLTGDTATLPEAGVRYTIDIGGTDITYTTDGSETTLAAIASGIANAINSDATVNALLTASVSGDTVVLTSEKNGLSGKFTAQVESVVDTTANDLAATAALTTAADAITQEIRTIALTNTTTVLPEPGEIYTFTANGKAITYTTTAADGNLNAIATGIAAAISAAFPIPNDIVSAAAGGSDIIITARDVNTPFPLTVDSITTKGTTMAAGATTTTMAANWAERLSGMNSIVFKNESTSATLDVDPTSSLDVNGNVVFQRANAYSVSAIATALPPAATNAVEFNGDGTPNKFFGSDQGTGGKIEIFLGNLDQGGGMTQFSGPYQIDFANQNGAKFGNFAGVTIGRDGIVTAMFDNGVTKPVFMIPVATFVNPNGMESLTGNVWIDTDFSGAPTLREAGKAGAGEVNAAALESSTVDLGEEFTNMITTQRAYSAAAKIITTADEMLDELVRIKR